MVKIRIDDLQPIAATQAKVRFGDILHQTSVNGKKFVVDRHGKPVSVILSYREYCELVGKKGGEQCGAQPDSTVDQSESDVEE